MNLKYYLTALMALAAFSSNTCYAEQQPKDEQFKDVEVRVIRQKYFQKSNRVEFNATIATIMNKPFILSFGGNGKLGYHLNEQFELFGEGGIGGAFNKTECTMLGDKFKIEPIVHYPANWYGGGVSYTPVYGKYQLTSGDVLYFDWFFSLELGLATLIERASSCVPNQAGVNETPFNQMQYMLSTGQRYFINKDVAVIWNLKFFGIKDPAYESFTEGLLVSPKRFLTVSIGASYFL